MEKMFNIAEVKLSYSCKVRKADRYTIRDSRSAYKLMKKIHPEDTLEFEEQMYMFVMNNATEVIGVKHLSTGGLTGTVVDVSTVLTTALLSRAKNIMLWHNHPSGQLRPSLADITITKKVAEACNLLDIKLLDHIIITPESYYSMADGSDF